MTTRFPDFLTAERATAYVLGALTPPEREEVARERLYHPALDAHIAMAERLFADVAPRAERQDDEPPLTPGTWTRIAAALAEERLAHAGKPTQEFAEGDWQAHGPRIDFKPTWSSDAVLIRCEPGAAETSHPQPADLDEHILVIAGDLVIGIRSFGIGDYIRVPAGTVHERMTTRGGCILFTAYVAPAA